MPKPIIEVENLSKLYRLGVIGSTTLRDSVERWWYRARGREEMCQKIGAKRLMIEPDDPQAGPEPNTIWALKDISFSVQPGEIIGIIGKNGAGKTTLLKILTRITEPTSGRAIIRGRISSMLEVGTGFHPELTGRENIYLNGAILGMRKTEIDRKFDEIVDFSGIEKFIDTPAKRYSSGMYVRLAFAVAAHLEPEILLVDEVLAVGDVAKEGRTVLFVSHNMGVINRLCERGIWLDGGQLRVISSADQTVREYLSSMTKITSAENLPEDLSKSAQLLQIRTVDAEGMRAKELDRHQPICLNLEFVLRQNIPGLYITFSLWTIEGLQVLLSDCSESMVASSIPTQPGKYVAHAVIPPSLLAPGRYIITAGLASSYSGPIDRQDMVHAFDLFDVKLPRTKQPVLAVPVAWEIDSFRRMPQ
jgi:lipopolysaccharide transport system ATP-binding protein